jgi:hypothetical protein
MANVAEIKGKLETVEGGKDWVVSRATDAIARSASHNEVVTLDYDAAAYEELLVECDDNVSTEDVTEFWGNDPDDENKMTWRVHVKHAPDDAGDRAYDEARDRELTERE